MSLFMPCPDCGEPMMWELDRVRDIPWLSSKCMRCDPAGPWHQEPCEVVRKPRGRAGLWPAASDAPLAPVDVSEV